MLKVMIHPLSSVDTKYTWPGGLRVVDWLKSIRVKQTTRQKGIPVLIKIVLSKGCRRLSRDVFSIDWSLHWPRQRRYQLVRCEQWHFPEMKTHIRYVRATWGFRSVSFISVCHRLEPRHASFCKMYKLVHCQIMDVQTFKRTDQQQSGKSKMKLRLYR